MRSVMKRIYPRSEVCLDKISRLLPYNLLGHIPCAVNAMRSFVNLGKHVENPQSENCLDRISSLPDELLVHILMFLPTRCAVSTTVLSTRWKYLYTLMSRLSFEDSPCCGVHDETEENLKIMFKDFVDRVLGSNLITPLEKFSLACQGKYDSDDFDSWVSTAVKRGVQEIDYQLHNHSYPPPKELFACETLVTLKISCSCEYRLGIPNSFRLPRLKILHLESITLFYNDSEERFFSGCELLEELNLDFCESNTLRHVTFYAERLKVLTVSSCSFKKGLFEIDAPKLEVLKYECNTGVRIVPSWKYSESLVEAALSFNHRAEDDSNYNSLQYDRGLVKAAAYKATLLYFMDDSLELLLMLPEHEEMPDFHNLARLFLRDWSDNAWTCLTSLLDKSPQLKTVSFPWGLHRCRLDSVTPPNEALLPFSCHLKKIEVHNFCGHECSLLFLGHLLRNAGELQTLILHKFTSVNPEEDLRISSDLLMLPRASRDCCIELKYATRLNAAVYID